MTTGTKPRDVYLIRQGDTTLVKIGCSGNVRARIQNLQIGNPSKLSIVLVAEEAGQSIETDLHRLLSGLRRRGEWFDLDDGTIDTLVKTFRLLGFAVRFTS